MRHVHRVLCGADTWYLDLLAGTLPASGLCGQKRYETSPAVVQIFFAGHPEAGQSVYVTVGVGGVPWFISSTGDPLRPCHDPAAACAAVTELMGELMTAFDELPRVRKGPLDSLYATVRRRAPQVSTARPDGGVLRVGYRGRTAEVVWDDDLKVFAWRSWDGGRIGSDAEKAAEVVASALDAPVTPGASG